MKKFSILLVILGILEISLALYLTTWRMHFWDAIQLKQPLHFLQQLGIFTVVALVICFVTGISGYLVSLTAIKWREKLNAKALTVLKSRIENINQRIQEDCQTYPDLVLNLAFGTLKAIIYIVVFSVSLLLSFHWWFLAILLGYSLIGTGITHCIAKPLIRLNYDNQRAEATYRNDLSVTNFNDCIRLMLGLAKKQKHLTYFQQFYGQLGVLIPILIIAPQYFTSAMTLGVLMRFTSLSSTILENLSYGINSFAQINRLLSCRRRLKEINVIGVKNEKLND